MEEPNINDQNDQRSATLCPPPTTRRETVPIKKKSSKGSKIILAIVAGVVLFAFYIVTDKVIDKIFSEPPAPTPPPQQTEKYDYHVCLIGGGCVNTNQFQIDNGCINVSSGKLIICSPFTVTKL